MKQTEEKDMPTSPIEYDLFVSYARLDNNDARKRLVSTPNRTLTLSG